MAVSVMARCGPSLRPSTSSGPRRFHAQPCRAPVSFVRVARPLRTPPQAFCRSNNWDEAAMRELMQDMAKAWKEGKGNMGGVFYWPGGGYVYGSGQGRKPYSADIPTSSQQQSSSNGLPLDVVSTDGFYLLYADVPGLAKSDLSIKLNKERVIIILGERKPPVEEGFSQKERRFGAFTCSWPLPEDADSEGISAKVTEGVLTITVPKKQPEPEVDDAQDIEIS